MLTSVVTAVNCIYLLKMAIPKMFLLLSAYDANNNRNPRGEKNEY